MKKETYSCNLCNEEHDREDLLAMYAEKNGSFDFKLYRFGQLMWERTHRHVCKDCVALIKESTP